MAQMNEFLRNFAQKFNEIMKGGENLNGDKVNFSFITAKDVVSGEDIDFITIDSAEEPDNVYSTWDDNGYFKLTCRYVSVDSESIKDPSLIATTKNSIKNGVDQYDIVEELLLLKKDTVMYRGGGADDFLQCMIADISVDTEEAKIFSANYENVSGAIDNQRMSVSGVDEDEEALNLVKFQNAYNLSSKMISVLTEIYDRLILETGV